MDELEFDNAAASLGRLVAEYQRLGDATSADDDDEELAERLHAAAGGDNTTRSAIRADRLAAAVRERTTAAANPADVTSVREHRARNKIEVVLRRFRFLYGRQTFIT